MWTKLENHWSKKGIWNGKKHHGKLPTVKDYLLWFGGELGVAAAAKSLQSCPTLCDPILGILQARTLEWVAISFSNA